MKVGWSKFALDQHVIGSGLSYSRYEPKPIIDIMNWDYASPGMGETDLSRKVVVPLRYSIGFYCPPTVALHESMELIAEATCRQPGEDPYIEVFTSIEEAVKFGFVPTPAMLVEVVCYSVDALLENGGSRSTDCDWEIVAMLCHDDTKKDIMSGLTMARNYLQKAGGTFTDYTAKEFAESIYYHSTRKGVKVKGYHPTAYFSR